MIVIKPYTGGALGMTLRTGYGLRDFRRDFAAARPLIDLIERLGDDVPVEAFCDREKVEALGRATAYAELMERKGRL